MRDLVGRVVRGTRAARAPAANGEGGAILRTNPREASVPAKLALPALRCAGDDVVAITSAPSKRGWSSAAAHDVNRWGLPGAPQPLYAVLRIAGIRVAAIVAGAKRMPRALEGFPGLEPARLADPAAVARTMRFAPTQPRDSAIGELPVVALGGTSCS
jgi:hypothetical protein